MSGRKTITPCHEAALVPIPGTTQNWYSSTGTTDYQCLEDGRVWRLRWQYDAGTGHDDYWLEEITPSPAPIQSSPK